MRWQRDSIICTCVGTRRITRAETHGFVEHARLPVLVLPRRAIYEAVAEHVVVNAAVSAHPVGRRAREPLHAVVRVRALCKVKHTVGPLVDLHTLTFYAMYEHLCMYNVYSTCGTKKANF